MACTLTRRGPPSRTAGIGATAGAVARLHPDGSALGLLRRAPGRLAHPGRGRPSRSRRIRRRPRRSADDGGLVADAVRDAVGDAPCDVLGYSLGARVALHVLTRTDLPVGRSPSDRRHRRDRGPGRAGAPPRCGRGRGRRPRGVGRRRGLPRLVAARAAVRTVGRRGGPGRAAAQQRGGTGLEPAPVRHGDPGTAVGRAGPAPLPRPGAGGDGRHPVRRPRVAGGAARALAAWRRWCPAAGTPCTWPSRITRDGSWSTGSLPSIPADMASDEQDRW